MASRDPQTGQFVSGSGTATNYRDHQGQHVRATFRDNGLPADGKMSIADIVEVTPPGDRRQEEAELVALHVHNLRTEIDEAEVTDGDGIRAGFEISRDEDIGSLTQYRTERDLSNNTLESDTVSNAASALSRQTIQTDNDQLWFALLRGEAGGGGRVNARGGPWYIDFRRTFGSGPIFTGGDAIHVHGRVNSIARASNWVTDVQFSLYWAVRDRD